MIAFAAVVFTILVPGTLMVLVPALMLANGSPAESPPPWFHHLGWALIVPGALVVLWCVREFVVTGRGTPAPVRPPTELVIKGLYRWTRNPMYVGVVCTLLGEALLFWSLPLLVHATCTWLAMQVFTVWYEEPGLARRFGESYEVYRRRVPRWVWWLRG
jgi:protein-S-isoprenylcysteine O-methyltransferase Ste14